MLGQHQSPRRTRYERGRCCCRGSCRWKSRNGRYSEYHRTWTRTRQLRIQRDQNRQLTEDNATIASQLRQANEEIAYLRSYIKKHVLPDQAEAVFLASRNPKTAVLQATPFVTGSINQQTADDRSLRVMAKESARTSSYEDLF